MAVELDYTRIGDSRISLTCEKDFQMKISPSALLGNSKIMKFICDSELEFEVPKHPDGTYIKTNQVLGHAMWHNALNAQKHNLSTRAATESVSRFDVVMDREWKTSLGPRHHVVPDIEIQHRERLRQLMEMKVPQIDAEYFFRDYSSFIETINSWVYNLNDSQGDFLADECHEFSFEPIAIMTDYYGSLKDNSSWSMDKELISKVLSMENPTFRHIYSLVKSFETGRLGGYVGIICENKVTSYIGSGRDTYSSYSKRVLNSPSEESKTYVRFSFLGGEKLNEDGDIKDIKISDYKKTST